MLFDSTSSKIRTMTMASSQPLPWSSSMAQLIEQPFRLLLYLEWLSLGTVGLIEVLLPFHLDGSLLLRVGAIVGFGLMGFRLPIDQGRLEKILYTALEFGLIILLAGQDDLATRSVFLLCLVASMRSCLIFQQTGQIIVLVLSLLTYGLLHLTRPIPLQRATVTIWDWRLTSVLMFALTLVFALLLINALLAERQSREQLRLAHEQLEATHEQLRQYAIRIEDQATLQERNRIAREIHDGLGHTLAAQTIQINNALLYWQSNADQSLSFLKQAKQLGAEALLEIRRSVSVLRSNPLQGKSLQSAIEKLLIEFQHTTGIEPASAINLPISFSIEVNTALYRIVQESLTNIYKHAQATTVAVSLQQHAGTVHLSIEDNGKGFNPDQNTTGFGLQGMRERATTLGGQFQLYSQLGGGCKVSVSFPLAKLL